MDGVKRYHLYLTGVRECELGDYVLHSDALAREAALREGLAASRKNTEFAQESMQIFADEADKLQQRLTAAEQRSAELEVLLMNTAEVLRSGNGYGWEEAQADIIDAALKPTESGASDDDL